MYKLCGFTYVFDLKKLEVILGGSYGRGKRKTNSKNK